MCQRILCRSHHPFALVAFLPLSLAMCYETRRTEVESSCAATRCKDGEQFIGSCGPEQICAHVGNPPGEVHSTCKACFEFHASDSEIYCRLDVVLM
eukprot:2063758-Rhodomonas_salina.5